MADYEGFDPSEFEGDTVQAAPAATPTVYEGFDPSEFEGDAVVQDAQSPNAPATVKAYEGFDPSEFEAPDAAVVDSQYKNISAPPKAYTNSVREDMLSRWQTTYSKMPDGPERERYGKLLATAWDSHVDMQRYNDPLLFRAAETGTVTGGVGVMKGGLAAGEILLSLPGVDAIPGAEGAKQSLAGMRENLQAKQKLFESKEEQFDKEAAIGETAAGLTRDMSGFATQLLMAYTVPGAGATATTVPVTRTAVSVGEVALATMLGSEAAAESLSKHPGDAKTALLHGVVNGGGALFMGKSGDLLAKFGGKVTPRAVRAVSNRLKLTPIFEGLAHTQGAGAEMAATAAADYMMDVALTKDDFDSDELVTRMKGAYKAGMVMGGGAYALGKASGKLTELGETMKKRQEEAPIAAKAITDAREMYRKNEADIEAGIAAKFKEGETLPEGYKEYFDEELNTLQSLENEYKGQFKSVNLEREQIKTRREETLAHLDELDRLDAEVRGEVIDPTGKRIYKQNERADMMVEGTEAAIKDLDGMRSQLLSELKGLDEREFAVNNRAHSLDRNGKSVKDFVESELDRMASDEALVTEQSAHDKFSKDLDDAVALENEIATGGRTRPEPPIPGQESANVPDTANDVELIDRLGHFTISGKQRDQNKMREFFDLDKLPPQVSKGFEETIIRAEQRGLINRADDIALDALTSDKLIPDEEFAAVVVRGQQNHGKYVQLMKERAEAKTPQEKADIDANMKGLEDQQKNLTEAAHRNNSDVARRLNLSKMVLQQAYDPIALLSKADRALASRADKFATRELSATERDDLLGIAKRISDNAAIKRQYPDTESKQFKTADYQEWLAKADADLFINRLRPRSLARKAFTNATLGLQDISKALTLSMDASIMTLHGGIPAQLHPSTVIKSLPSYGKTLLNSEELLAAYRRLEKRPNADLYHKYDIGVRDVTNPMSKNEAILLSEYSGRIPLLRNSNNANTSALNEIRANLFDTLVELRGGRDSATHEGLQSIANFTRTASGHGGLGPFEAVAKELSFGMLSPRWFVSRFQHLLQAPGNLYRALQSGDAATFRLLGKEYAKQYAVTAGIGYGVAALASLAYPGRVSYTADPTSPKFGIATINGTDYDLTSGMRKPVVLISSAVRAATGTAKPLDTVQTVGGLVTNSLGPGGRFLNELMMRKEMGSGRKIDLSDPNQVAWFAGKNFIPLPIQTAVRGLVDEGLSPRVAQEVVASFMGVSAWKHKAKKGK